MCVVCVCVLACVLCLCVVCVFVRVCVCVCVCVVTPQGKIYFTLYWYPVQLLLPAYCCELTYMKFDPFTAHPFTVHTYVCMYVHTLYAPQDLYVRYVDICQYIEIYSTQTPSPNLDPNDPRPIDSFILLIHNFIYHSAAWDSDALVCLGTWCTLIII